MPDQSRLAEGLSRLADPMNAPLAKATGAAATGGASTVVGAVAEYAGVSWVPYIALVTALASLIFILMQIVAISPTFWKSIHWWFGKERRANHLPDPPGGPRRRFTDKDAS